MPEPSSTYEPIAEPRVDDILELLLRQKGILIASALFFGVLGGIYTATTKPAYEVKATILLPQSKSLGGAASLAASLGVSGLGGGGGGGDSLPMFRKILESNTVTTAIAQKFGIKKQDLRSLATIDDDAKTNTIDLTVRGKDAALSKRIADEYLRQLRLENMKLSLPGKSRKAQIIASTLNANTRALAAAEDRLKTFVSSAVTAPGVPSAANLGASKGNDEISIAAGGAPVFRYQDQITTLTLQLDKLNSQLGQIDSKSAEAGRVQALDFPPVANWRKKLDESAGKLAEARARYSEESAEVREAKRGYDEINRLMQTDISKYLSAVEGRVTGNVSQLDQDRTAVIAQIAAIRRLADAAPRESLAYQRLLRDVATLSSLVSQFRIQYEQAKLESADDPNRWEILDAPTVGDEPTNKKYSRNVALAAFLGLFVAAPFALRRAKRMA